MRCSTLLVVLIVGVSLIACREEEFHCKPKLGCHITKCDTAPFRTFGRIEDYLERNEFPISCKFRSDGISNAEILSQIADMQKEMVDLKTENQLLRVRLQSVESDNNVLKKDMNRKEMQMQEMKLRIDVLELESPAFLCASTYNGIAYNGSCLWSENAPMKMDLTTALKTCNNRAPSKLPEVYGETEYLKIMEYLRSKIPDGEPDVFAWTGMTRDHSTGKAVLSNGEHAPYTKPRSPSSLWTRAEARRTNVYLTAKRSSTDIGNGMASIWPEYEFTRLSRAVLCLRI